MQSFGEKLAAARAARGMTQGELAEALNVSRSTVSSWERSRTQPDLQTLRALSDLLGSDFFQDVPEADAAATPDVPAAEAAMPAAPPAAAGIWQRKKWWVIAGCALLVCAVVACILLLPRKGAPADGGERFHAETYLQETPNEAGKAYIAFENSRSDENIGDNTYSIYNFQLCERNGVGFKITSVEISMESTKSETARTVTLAPEELEKAGFGSSLEPYGTLSINGGWPKGEFRRVGIAVRGTDDNGAALAFYSMIEF